MSEPCQDFVLKGILGHWCCGSVSTTIQKPTEFALRLLQEHRCLWGELVDGQIHVQMLSEH